MTKENANSSDERDQALIVRIMSGEADALEQLCDHYSRILLGICFRILWILVMSAIAPLTFALALCCLFSATDAKLKN
jgi:hypothetical protein